jgi:hypothetical protein
MALERRLKQSEKRAAHRSPSDEQMEEWGRQAAERLSDEELEALGRAVEREKALESDVFPQLKLERDEQAAFDKWLEYFEKAAKRGV